MRNRRNRGCWRKYKRDSAAYVLKIGPVLAVVNGQTGRVAVSKAKAEKVMSWLIEPTLMTLAVAAVTWLCYPVLEMVGMMTLVFGMIFFTAFSDGRGDEFRRKVFKSEKSRAERVQSKLTVTQGEDAIEDTTTRAVFMEPVNGEMVPVKISFYTPFRIIMTMLAVVVFNAFPAIVAWIFDADGTANYSYIGIWMTLSVPITLILWIAFGRIRVYNYPLLEMILPDGRTKPVKSDNARPIPSPWQFLKQQQEMMGTGMFLFFYGTILIIILGTLAAMLTPD